MAVIGHGYDDNVGAPAFRNVIINGGFDVWQRGTSFVMPLASPYYGADRWQMNRLGLGSGATYSRVATDLTGFTYHARCQRDSGNTGTGALYLDTSFETVNVRRLQGKYLTLSFWAKAGANYSATSNALSVQLWYGTGTDSNYAITGFTGATTALSSNATLTTSWTRFSFTTSAVLPTTATQLAVRIFSSHTGTAGAADYYDITGVQLEAGSVATPFEFEPFETTLRKCQRYYYKSYPQNVYFGIRSTDANREDGEFYLTLNAAPAGVVRVSFPVEMRATPIVDFAAWDTTSLNIANGGTLTVHQPGVGNRSATMYRKSATGVSVSSTAAANIICFFALQANAEL